MEDEFEVGGGGLKLKPEMVNQELYYARWTLSCNAAFSVPVKGFTFCEKQTQIRRNAICHQFATFVKKCWTQHKEIRLGKAMYIHVHRCLFVVFFFSFFRSGSSNDAMAMENAGVAT